MRISDWSSDVCSSDLRRPFLRQRGVVDDQPCLVTADQRIGLAPQGRLQRRAVPKPRTDEVIQAIIADFARPRRHRLDALAIPRTDQARNLGRAHPLPGLVAKDRKSVLQGKSVSVRVALGGWRTV